MPLASLDPTAALLPPPGAAPGALSPTASWPGSGRQEGGFDRELARAETGRGRAERTRGAGSSARTRRGEEPARAAAVGFPHTPAARPSDAPAGRGAGRTSAAAGQEGREAPPPPAAHASPGAAAPSGADGGTGQGPAPGAPPPAGGPLPQAATTSQASPGPSPAKAPAATQGAQGQARAAPGAGSAGGLLRSPVLARALEDHRASLFRQISLSLSRDGGTVDMLLDPPELGRLGVRLEMEGGQARLVLSAERGEVAHMVRLHAEELRAALAAQGIHVASMDVRAGDPGEEHRTGRRGTLRARHGTAPAGSAQGGRDPAPPLWILEAGRIDIFV